MHEDCQASCALACALLVCLLRWGSGEDESSEIFSLISVTKLSEHSSERWEAFALT